MLGRMITYLLIVLCISLGISTYVRTTRSQPARRFCSFVIGIFLLSFTFQWPFLL